MTTNTGGDHTRLGARMLEHGATQVEMADLMEQAQVVWQIRAEDTVSETCIHAEELIASGARNCRSALEVMARMDGAEGSSDPDLATALKKYVEDACEAIKQVDNALKEKESDLAKLIFEVPDRSQHEMSWRDLIGRRDVIAHNLLTVDDQRIHREAKRDFGSLHELLSRLYFVPVKTHFEVGRGFSPLLKSEAVRLLSPAEPGRKPTIGQSLIFICEDEKRGFLAYRAGRSAKNHVLFTGPAGTLQITILGFDEIPVDRLER